MRRPALVAHLRATGLVSGWGTSSSFVVLAILLAIGLGGVAFAQEPEQPAPPPKAEAAQPEFEPVERVTSDGLTVQGFFFPSTETDTQNAVPVVLLHSWKGDGWKEFEGLARYLQERGCAVLVPNLRGHGQSTTFKASGYVLDPARMSNAEISNMVTKDMEAWRSFLVQKNDEKALNLNKLCLVGSEMGASVAINWALLDWRWSSGLVKDRRPSVEALVLLSPQKIFRGLDVKEPLLHPAVRTMSAMILVGRQDARAYSQASQLDATLAKYHPRPPKGLDKDELARWNKENRSLFFRSFDTSLQGSKLLGVRQLMAPEIIWRFIELRLADPAKSKDFPWQPIKKQ
jgi:pimeloyl-ACP methyl ester carboxylesterase